jgi:site-specific DNA-methyltransferase (adenine-specific)
MKTDTLDLRLMDCMDLMRDTPDGFYDLAVVDPPYGIGMDSRAMNGRQSKGRHPVTQSQYAEKTWDDESPSLDYFSEIARVSKNRFVWGANHFISKIPIDSSCWIVWFKNGQSMAPGNADCELAWTSFKTAVRQIDIPWSGFGHINAGEPRIHPTQKPIAFYRWIFANYAKPGMRILDTHLGSMSSAIAAHYSGMHLTGCELDSDYYAAGIARVKRETQQTELFQPAEIHPVQTTFPPIE